MTLQEWKVEIAKARISHLLKLYEAKIAKLEVSNDK